MRSWQTVASVEGQPDCVAVGAPGSNSSDPFAPRRLTSRYLETIGVKGTMVTIPVDQAKPSLVQELSRPPDLMTLFEAVGGPVERVPYFTSYEDANLSPYEHVGTLVRCVAFRNTDAHREAQPINERAQNMWMKSLLRQRKERSHQPGDVLCGPVVIFYGDNEFMERLS